MTESEALESALKKIIAQEKSNWGYIENFDVDENWAVRTAIEHVKQYRQIGTVEELKAASKYLRLVKKHGTVGKTIEEFAEYEEIGTVEECLKNKDFLDFLSDKMNPNDFETYLRLYNALEEKGCE